ncbi:MAG: deoxyribonuclease IV, partial [Candidatus Kapabacteria bacterium]|nr:deoxyribonuclease IV [Candidatus Kapabacteria bacterium]
IAGGLPYAVDRARALGCTVFQLFTANARQWSLGPVTAETATAFQQARQAAKIAKVISHAVYLLNLASPRKELRRKSLVALEAECHRCQQLGIELVTFHPGSCPAEERREGLRHVAQALRSIAQNTNSSLLLCVELTAGQGSSIGSSLEELAAIIEQSSIPERLGICVDTCHALAAGYRLDTEDGYDSFWARLVELCGQECLRVLHLNDSAYPPGRRRDRHTHIGFGYCGLGCFTRLLHDPRWHNVPMILETPKGKDDTADQLNLAVLRRLAAGASLSPEELRQLWRRHGPL